MDQPRPAAGGPPEPPDAADAPDDAPIETWRPRLGLGAKIVAWAILIGVAVCVLAIAATIFLPPGR